MGIHPAFAFYAPSEEAKETITRFRNMFSVLLSNIENSVPACAERTLCQRSLEEANVWLNKAINRTDKEAKPDLGDLQNSQIQKEA